MLVKTEKNIHTDGLLENFEHNITLHGNTQFSNQQQGETIRGVNSPRLKDNLSIESLSQEERDRIMEIVSKIPLSSSNDVLNYGIENERRIAQQSNEFLSAMQSTDLGEAGEMLAVLVTEIQNFDISSENNESRGFLSYFFNGVNKGVRQTEKIAGDIKKEISLTKKQIKIMQNRYRTVLQNIESIVEKLEAEQQKMLKNIVVMERLYDTNLRYFKSITIDIIAGKEKLKLFEEQEVNAQKLKATETNDQMDIQILNEKMDIANRFEKRLHDLTLSRMVSIQSAPQIRLIQKGSEELVSQIQNSINTAIPIWKSQMVLALGIVANKTAVSIQKQVTDMTNDLLVKNSEMLKLGSLEIAHESERGIISIETLKRTNDNLIATINGVIEIHKKGKNDRYAAGVEMQKLEQDVKTALLNK
jgi:uncharacterized protein YaaN involved in tellurite resistance